eukprot:jgi/Chlat1/3003/Chrsp2S00365
MATTARGGRGRSSTSALAKAYLFLYNAVQAAGWAYALVLLVTELLSSRSHYGTYAAAGGVINAFQLAAFLEVIHAALGLVRSNPALVFLQWLGRSHVLFACVYSVDEVKVSPALPVMFAAWALTEVVRYPQYALSTIGASPAWLDQLRYTIFIPLYPIGVLSEVALLYQAIPYVARRQIHYYNTQLAGTTLNFQYDKFIKLLLVPYFPAWAVLYVHMFKQRASKLRRSKRE